MHLVDTTLFYSPTSGGVRRYLNAKHEWLARHTSWEHTLLVPGERFHIDRGGLSTLPGPPVPTSFNYRLPLNPRRWREALYELEPDLIEVGDAFQPAWAATEVGAQLGIPVVGFYHSNLPHSVGRRLGTLGERALQRYLCWVYEGCDRVLAPSRLMCAYLEAMGVRHTVFQPHGVDSQLFHPKRRGTGLRAELGLPEQTRLLVFAGRFAAEKNLPLLFDAIERLGEPYHLLLVGSHQRTRPRPQVTQLPYTRDARELARIIASADALVHAGTEETFGLVLLEAMACGRPVVATRAGAIPEFVDSSVGELAEPLDSGSLAEAIAALYERDLDALGAAARERVQRHYTWSRSFNAQTELYLELVGEHERAAAARGSVELRSAP